MNGFLVDTNVVSELTRDVPDARVLAFLVEHDELWLSAIVLHELDFGIGLLPLGRRRDSIGAILSTFVTEYGDRILPVGYSEATQAAVISGQMHSGGSYFRPWRCAYCGDCQNKRSCHCDKKSSGF